MPEDPAGRSASSPKPPRRGYLDWVRGLAVLIMIEAHVLDSWTWAADRETPAFVRAIIAGGFGAPLFLFLAGVSVPLSAGAKMRRTGDRRLASRAVTTRGLEVFGLAFLFRLQAWILGWSSWRALLKVDILNIMGPSIAAAALLWGAAKSRRGRIFAFTALTAALVFATPLIRMARPVALADPLEAYVWPVPGLSNFVLFPWVAFVFAGGVIGLLLDATVARDRERALNVWFVLGGASLAGIAYAASFLPTPYPRSDFWTTSPSYFFLRTGVMTAAVGLAYAWESRPGAAEKWSPMRELGLSSLFVYWIHVELVYGLISLPLHKALPLWQSLIAFVLFAALMLGCAILKDRAVAWWRRQRSRGRAATWPFSRSSRQRA